MTSSEAPLACPYWLFVLEWKWKVMHWLESEVKEGFFG